MKQIKKCPILTLLVLSAMFLTLCGYLGKKNIYKDYSYNIATTPILSLVMSGIGNDAMPWDYFSYIEELEVINPDMNPSDSKDEFQSGMESISENTENNYENIPIINNIHESTPAPVTYDFTPVTLDYLDDALFIGDSRTRGLCLYSGWDNTTFYAETGLTIYTLFDKKVVPVEGSSKLITIEESLEKEHFSKIYVMIGINELGTGTPEEFYDTYENIIGRIHELQPDAIIFVEGIIHVSEKKDKEGSYINNESIVNRNQLLSTLANHSNIFYLDANEALCDENGFLIDEYTFDGVHLRAANFKPWKDYILDHGIIK
ncbi:MAG TPA: GDSL-type esterase/lipase family protein [Lachnospiraceae bacterium]|nr:GDSL-type esterase/lipase family protein [Lachnospiraceae bacterium]